MNYTCNDKNEYPCPTCYLHAECYPIVEDIPQVKYFALFKKTSGDYDALNFDLIGIFTNITDATAGISNSFTISSREIIANNPHIVWGYDFPYDYLVEPIQINSRLIPEQEQLNPALSA